VALDIPTTSVGGRPVEHAALVSIIAERFARCVFSDDSYGRNAGNRVFSELWPRAMKSTMLSALPLPERSIYLA
jgi:hypothetical protein